MAAAHFIGSFLAPSWAKVISGEIRRKAGVKVVTQRGLPHSKKRGKSNANAK